MIAETFKSLVNPYSDSPQKTEELWEEIVHHYADNNRHYHTLEHLEHLYTQILPHKDQILDLDSLLFALYYHDVVYVVVRHDNEERSADFASKRLASLGVPNEKIEVCRRHIMATKDHAASAIHDINIFTDADLSILGQGWQAYNLYCQEIRKEYAIYPDLVYKPGRKKVLNHFLKMDRIFKTEPFYEQYENRARLNIEKEISLL